MDYKNVKMQFMELPQIDAASPLLRFNCGTQNFLRQKQMVSLEAFTITDMPLSPNGLAMPTGTQFKSATLTLYGDNPENTGAYGDWVQNIPLTSLHRINNGTDPYVFSLALFTPRKIVWEKSFITLTAPLANGAPMTFGFMVGYTGNEGDNA